MKKLMAMLLCGTLAVSALTGCGGSGQTAASGEKADSAVTADNTDDTAAQKDAASDAESGEAADEAAAAIAERKAKAEESGEYQKIVVSFFDWTGAPAGLERVNAAISEHTRETLGLDVELMIIDSAAYSENIKLMLSSGEQVDVFSTCGPGYMTCVNNGYALDLEEDGLFEKYAAGIRDTVREEYLDACRVGGILYGIPPIKDYAIQTAAVCVGTEYLDAIGFDYEGAAKDALGYVKGDWDMVNDIFSQIHEAFPDKYVMAIQDNALSQGSSVDPIGGDYYGSLLDPQNSLAVENVYESDLFREWCQRAYDWNQAGYISKDAMTDKTGASAKVKSGAYMAMMACSKPGYQTQITGECGRPMTVIDVGESFMSSSSVSSFPWCVNQSTEDPAAAVQVLDALYTDGVLEDLMCWGQEGVEYVVNEDQTIQYAEGVDANNSEYYPNVLWMMPNPYVAHVWTGDPLDIGQQMSDFNDNCPNKSKALGFTWDNSDYSSEYTALTNAYDQYAGMAIYGFVEPEQGISDLNNALKEAGLEKYMAAKQEALDAWAEENNVK